MTPCRNVASRARPTAHVYTCACSAQAMGGRKACTVAGSVGVPGPCAGLQATKMCGRLCCVLSPGLAICTCYASSCVVGCYMHAVIDALEALHSSVAFSVAFSRPAAQRCKPGGERRRKTLDLPGRAGIRIEAEWHCHLASDRSKGNRGGEESRRRIQLPSGNANNRQEA